MNRIEDVVNFFLSKSAMSPKKLQKLLYYAYSWTLALLNDSADDIHNRLFDDPIEAWIHGPVVPSVYGYFKEFGWSEIPQNEYFDSSVFSPEVIDILNQVWEVYGGYTGNQLEAFSHREDPWIEARKGLSSEDSSHKRLSDRVIFDYFNRQAIAQ